MNLLKKRNINSDTLPIIARMKMAFAHPNLMRKVNHRVSSAMGRHGLNSSRWHQSRVLGSAVIYASRTSSDSTSPRPIHSTAMQKTPHPP